MLWSPGYGGHTSAVLVNEMSPSVEHPAVVEGHQSVSGCGGCVLSVLSVCVLQRGELVLSEHLIHNKRPVTNTEHPISTQANRRLASQPSSSQGLKN